MDVGAVAAARRWSLMVPMVPGGSGGFRRPGGDLEVRDGRREFWGPNDPGDP